MIWACKCGGQSWAVSAPGGVWSKNCFTYNFVKGCCEINVIAHYGMARDGEVGGEGGSHVGCE
eukprot:1621661-Pyramimonas_sp.AAC.1